MLRQIYLSASGKTVDQTWSVQAPDHKHKRIMNPKANAKSKDKGGSEYQKGYGLPQLTLGSMASIVFTGDNV